MAFIGKSNGLAMEKITKLEFMMMLSGPTPLSKMINRIRFFKLIPMEKGQEKCKVE
ncbi:hypothetical protein SAMN06296020_12136 [Anoxynatronum buryatiense]|uniref:Uncharacterized protein n=1 Tax=Anoxynatronum buryatiense TaxID=489973 RepID=A0AA46AKI0_9CLOT|nr:hypothetical protein SAMN06296020_12136 [Anoxynatronum buryatiense]